MLVTKFPASAGYQQILITIMPEELRTPDVGKANVINTLLSHVKPENSNITQLASIIALDAFLHGDKNVR